MQAAQTMTVMGPLSIKRRPQGAIWLALAFALLVHIILLLVPASRQHAQPLSRPSKIVVQVQYEDIQPFLEPRTEPVTEPDDTIESSSLPAEQTPREQAVQGTAEPLPVPTPAPAQPIPAHDRPAILKNPQQLSRTILSSQFI